MLAVPLPSTAADRAAMTQSMKGWLSAWDPLTQREVWRVDHGGPWNGGVLATGGNVIFQGTSDGRFHAYRATDGRELWSFDAQTAVMAGPISYELGGTQYVAVMAGNGGGVELALPAFAGPHPSPNGRVLAFSLQGAAQLPPFNATAAPPQQVAETWPAADIEVGRAKYAQYCATCHGMGTFSAGVVPDLRRSAVLNSREAWSSVVIDGVRTPAGMVSFRDRLSPAQADNIRGYVAGQAQQARGASAQP